MDYAAERAALARAATELQQAQERFDNAAPVDMPDDQQSLQEAIDDCIAKLGRAERAMRSGDMEAARGLMWSAGADLIQVVEA
jgi:hypothetical protein